MQMFNPGKRSSFGLLVFLLLAVLLVGCSEDLGMLKENQAPTVWLSSSPPEGSVSKYTVHLYWGGWDPDGEIHYYEYCITDNKSGIFDPADTVGASNWHRVVANDSIFSFSADQLADSSSIGTKMGTFNFIRSHTFFIRAVDQQGLASLKPVYRSFTATTLSPEINIDIPVYNPSTPALLPPNSRFYWKAWDYAYDTKSSQNPDSVRWILVSTKKFNDDYGKTLKYIRNNPHAPEWWDWRYYDLPEDSGKFWSTPPLEFGAYVFAVQAKDEAGAVTPVFDPEHNVRNVIVSRTTLGPQLILRNDYLGSVKAMTEGVSYTIIDLPSGLGLRFCWRASAESYGGVVVGYRYGWDISDFSRDDLWTDWTPFVRTWECSPTKEFFYGTHTFHVEAIDNSGFITRINIKINYIPFSMESSLLLVDDFPDNPSGLAGTHGAVPSDEEHDNFWKGVLCNLKGFNPVDDMVEVSTNSPLSIVKLAHYKTVIWDADAGWNKMATVQPFLNELIMFHIDDPDQTPQGKVQPNLLALFLASGGHLFICGYQPMTAGINTNLLRAPKFPVIIQYELGGNQDGVYNDQADTGPVAAQSFIFQDMCIDVLEIAYTEPNSLRTNADNTCGVKTGPHKRGVRPREDGLRYTLPIDMNFPALALRPEVTAPDRIYRETSKGLDDELYDPGYFTCLPHDLGPRACFEPIYGHGCLDPNSPLFNAPAAAWTSVYDTLDPEVPGGVRARSTVWGFEPFFMDTTAVRQAIEKIIFDEWQLPRK